MLGAIVGDIIGRSLNTQTTFRKRSIYSHPIASTRTTPF